MELDPRLFLPSGLNSSFNNPGKTFADYIAQTQTMITQARIDITSDSKDQILAANTPYNWVPSQAGKIKQGILLIHGLYDSPFTLKDLGQHFLKQGFMVRSILLPGHGTVPGDLLKIHRSEWIKAVDYGFESLRREVDRIFICAYSMGCSLALRKATETPDIHGLILLAPALKLYRNYWAQLCRWHGLISWMSADLKWYRKIAQKNYTKYESFNFDAAYQGCKLAQETRVLLQKKPLAIPLFIAQSSTDETVVAESVIDIFQQQPNPNNRLLIYRPVPNHAIEKRITQLTSYFPEKNILDFSHTCLPISPDNYFYGVQGIFKDFAHYQHRAPAVTDAVYMGSLSKKNLSQHIVQRLSYNPEFEHMLSTIDQFLHKP